MAITKSAKKALRQNISRRVKNVKNNQNLRKALKEARALIAEKKIDEVKKRLPEIYKILDKAAKTGLIKENAASRKKSRITKAILKAR